MRIIKQIWNLRKLYRCGSINERESELLLKKFLELDEMLEEEFYVVLIEDGDCLRSLGVLGLDEKKGGIVGTLPQKVIREEEFIIYYYRYRAQYICLVIPILCCSNEIKDFLDMYMEE